MISKVILLILSLWCSSAFGQTYIEYYILCNDADKAKYYGNDELALSKLVQAFKTVDYVHADKYEKASKWSLETEDYASGYEYARKAILHGSTSRYWEHSKLKKFRKTNFHKMLLDSVRHWEQAHVESINIPFRQLVDSLHYVDQRIVRKNLGVQGDYQIDKTKLPEKLSEIDQNILKTLVAAIREYRFPSEKNIGPQGYDNVWVIFHHNVRLPHNHKYIPFLEEALRKGEYRPRDFAWMYDQGRLNINEPPSVAFRNFETVQNCNFWTHEKE